MKHVNDLDHIPSNYFTRTSRNKPDENIIVSKIEDYQTSMTTFSAKYVNKMSINSINSFKEKTKGKKRVEFNPLITVINIQSYKKENYFGPDAPKNNDSDNIKKCISCEVF